MNEMLEKVARAIWARVPAGYGMTKDEATEYARAAIETIREPTEAMLLAVWPLHHPWGKFAPAPEDRPGALGVMKDEVRADWQTMIDSILNEGNSK